jgi:hypothetical protein
VLASVVGYCISDWNNPIRTPGEWKAPVVRPLSWVTIEWKKPYSVVSAFDYTKLGMVLEARHHQARDSWSS